MNVLQDHPDIPKMSRVSVRILMKTLSFKYIKGAPKGWYNERVNWRQEWYQVVFSNESPFCYQVVFSNESRFCLWARDGRKRVRRLRGERRNPQFHVECHTVLTQEVIWGTIKRHKLHNQSTAAHYF